MKGRVLLDVVLILALYLVYFAIDEIVAYAAVGDWPQALRMAILPQSIGVFALSLLCALAWYVLGEWGIRSYASRTTWYTVWALLFVAILLTATALVILDPLGDTGLQALMFLGGAGFYYLATLLFSPFHQKFLIWPSIHVRSW